MNVGTLAAKGSRNGEKDLEPERTIELYGWEMRGFLILVGFHATGIALHQVGVPLPASVLGLLLFLGALVAGIVKLKWVEESADFMVRHMLLLFVPLLAGLTVMGSVLRQNALALVASLVVSLVAVLLTTGGLAHFLLRDAGDETVD